MERADLNETVELIVDDITACQESRDELSRRVWLAKLQEDDNTEDRCRLEGFRLELVEKRLRQRLDRLDS